MVAKMLPAVFACGSCPNNVGSRCRLVNVKIHDPSIIPLFCTLPDHLATTVADLTASLNAERAAKDWGLASVLITYIAAKLGLTLSDEYHVVTIPFTDKNNQPCSVSLRYDMLQTMDPRLHEIPFFFQEKTWVLKLESTPPVLQEPIDDRPDLYQSHELNVVR